LAFVNFVTEMYTACSLLHACYADFINLIFIVFVGTSIEEFNGPTLVKKWLASGHRGVFVN